MRLNAMNPVTKRYASRRGGEEYEWRVGVVDWRKETTGGAAMHLQKVATTMRGRAMNTDVEAAAMRGRATNVVVDTKKKRGIATTSKQQAKRMRSSPPTDLIRSNGNSTKRMRDEAIIVEEEVRVAKKKVPAANIAKVKFQKPFAVRDCPPGMRIQGGNPPISFNDKGKQKVGSEAPTLKKPVYPRFPALKPAQGKQTVGSGAPTWIEPFDPTVPELEPDVDPHARVQYILDQYKLRVRFFRSRKERRLGSPDEGDCNGAGSSERPDTSAYKALSQSGYRVNGAESIEGRVPGIVVGDCFVYRAELVLVSLHKLLMGGIDYIPASRSPFHDKDGRPMSVAVSVIQSGGYRADVNDLKHRGDIGDGHTFLYNGQGGNHRLGAEGRVKDQEFERGNLALKNSGLLGIPVRVIRRHKCRWADPDDTPNGKMYRYEGRYKVTGCRQKTGSGNKTVLKFILVRKPGQRVLSRRL